MIQRPEQSKNTITHTEEVHVTREYKTMKGFITAVRGSMAKLFDEYPEDVLTAKYTSDETMETVLRRTGKYYYEDRHMNIDVDMNSHIYLCNKW